jgi:hypothetical protein
MGVSGDAGAVPQPIGVGPEMAALGRFYRDVTWKGTIAEGGMGQGTPAMTGVGRGKVEAIQHGRWIVLDCEQDQFLDDGTFVLKWQLHWGIGLVSRARRVPGGDDRQLRPRRYLPRADRR